MITQEKKIDIFLSAVKFYPGQKIKIIEPEINAVVLSVKIDEVSVMYNCGYWADRSYITIYLYGHELEVTNE